MNYYFTRGFPGGSDGKESACNAGALGALGRSPGEGNGHPFHILAWEIPRIEELGRLQFMRAPRVRLD